MATMDRSIGRLPDPLAGPPNRERRRCVRQKLHTPVYASFNGPQTGITVDLSELLDLNEEGFAVQTAQRLETNHAVNICLDLPETRAFVHGSGQVIWSDETGRGGIRFSQLGENSRKALQEWLFANLLIASGNHQARTAQLALHTQEKLSEPAPPPELTNLAQIFDHASHLSPLETVRNEVREIGDDVDEIQQLITDRALTLTGATGAALAFLKDDNMVWRARAGEPSPPVGAAVDIAQGVSGECVHSGLVVSCGDTQNDPRVDPEICRVLGIGSLMASPIVSDFRVVGLLEVFSPHPHCFARAQGTILERLSELVPKAHVGKAQVETSVPQVSPVPVEAERSDASEGVLPRATSDLAPVEPVLMMPTAVDVGAVHGIRQPLWDLEPEPRKEVRNEIRKEVRKEVAQPVSVATSSELVSEPQLEPLAEPEIASVRRSRLLYRALLGLAIAVVALAVGYVLGPIVEKRWPSSRRSSSAAVEAASPSSLREAADRAAVDGRNQVRSLADLQKLADQGDPEAQWQMAVRYHNGEGVPQDDTQAMKWFERAAEQGHVDAQSRLGAYYWAGRGVPEDLSKAYYWSAIATAQGDEISKSRLEGLTYQMTRAQISTARQQAEAWLHNHNHPIKPDAN